MSRLGLWMLLLYCLPALSTAGGAPACGSTVSDPVFAPAQGRALSRDEAAALARLFRSLSGEWRGSMVERVCMLSGATHVRHYGAQLKLSGNRADLRLAGEYVRQPGGAKRRFNRKLLLTGQGLRVDLASRVGEVELLQADAAGLAYVQRYRTVHRMPAEQPETDDGSGSSLVIGSENLVSGEDEPQVQPPPKRRSMSRAERFSLQAGGRTLVLVQDYYTQGGYAGSMRWELQRR